MHDRNGNPLKVGDKVNVPCVITACQVSDAENEYCNVTLQTEVPMAGNAYTISLNAKQTELVRSAERPPE